MEYLALQKLCATIDRQPDVVRAHKIFTNFKAATQDTRTAAYTAVATTLHTMAEKEPKTPNDTNPKPPNVKDAPLKLKPGPSNPNEASVFVSEIKKATDQFAQIIHFYEPYKIQDVYSMY